ncbi:MAG: hypothetical protein RI894_665 [Bacteroidota bacterium]|jgi:hypothetical protein
MNVSGLPEFGHRVVQTTVYEPIPKGEKASFPFWALLAILAAFIFALSRDISPEQVKVNQAFVNGQTVAR